MDRVFIATTGIALLSIVAGGPIAVAEDSNPLQLETKILLGDVVGRIDHMAVDLKQQRLFVAELGNDTVGIVDLANRKCDGGAEGLPATAGSCG
jgi:hypothetical protein